MEQKKGRIISFAHRIKFTKAGEPRPSIVAVSDGRKVVEHKLETELDEFDFIQGQFPTSYRKVLPNEDLTVFHDWQINRSKDGTPLKVPDQFDGLQPSDTIVTYFGGSGGAFCYAAFRKLKEINGQVLRIKPVQLKKARESNDKEKDHQLLLRLFNKQPEMFCPMVDKDADLIFLHHAFMAREEIKKARIACGQRIETSLIGRTFFSQQGGYPEGGLAKALIDAKANNLIFQGLEAEEKKQNRELEKIVRGLPVWEQIFEPIAGVGPVIAAGLIIAIGDIRRFETPAQLKRFLGCCPNEQGCLLRLKDGYNPFGRQALYLLVDQFNRRPDSIWGQKLREYKVKLRMAHPEKVMGPSRSDPSKQVSRYSDGHIHKMAMWATLGKFLEWLHREWTRIETDSQN